MLRVFPVIDHHGASQAIAVLILEMAVVPEGSLPNNRQVCCARRKPGILTAYCLIGNIEVVQERFTRRDRALCYESRAIVVVGSMLEKAVPML